MVPPAATIDLSEQGVEDTATAALISRLSINGVQARRSKGGQVPRGVAAFGSSEMFKGSQAGKPFAKEWDSHLSEESKSRRPSPLKQAARYLGNPGMISLGGGLPSSEYFPFERLDVKVPRVGQFLESDTRETGVVASAGKHDIAEDKSLYDLHVALNYGLGSGAPQLLRFVTEHTEIVHDPPYADWGCVLTVGSTGALDHAFRMLLERGDSLLVEEYTFCSALETSAPLGVKAIGVKMDAEGLVPSDMDNILLTWNPAEREGARKPRVLYTVPSGQNPTGATQSAARRHELYDVCRKHDIFIIEDEPYYFLQMQPYVAEAAGSGTATPIPPPSSHEEFLASLEPSLLSMDFDGRVLRLDSFSKTIAPGSRVGWVTGCGQILERFMRNQEVCAQNPSGISQLVLYKLLEEQWGHAGFLDWLIHLRMEYTGRRDVILRACEKYLPTSVASWVPPMAGMFLWIKIDHTKHPDAGSKSIGEIADEAFHAGVDRGVLTGPGKWFHAEGGDIDEIFVRVTFAAVAAKEISEAIRRFGEALRAVFKVE